MAKINKSEIIGAILGTAGLGVIAVGAPFGYYGEKFLNERYKEAEQPGGVLSRKYVAGINVQNAKFYYDNCYNQKLLEKKCSHFQEVYFSALNKESLLGEELKVFYSTQRKFSVWSNYGSKCIPSGLLLAMLGGFILLGGYSVRKEEEEQEAAARDQGELQLCSPLEQELYCEETDQPHLYGDKINNFCK